MIDVSVRKFWFSYVAVCNELYQLTLINSEKAVSCPHPSTFYNNSCAFRQFLQRVRSRLPIVTWFYSYDLHYSISQACLRVSILIKTRWAIRGPRRGSRFCNIIFRDILKGSKIPVSLNHSYVGVRPRSASRNAPPCQNDTISNTIARTGYYCTWTCAGCEYQYVA